MEALLSFATTQDAIRAERLLLESGEPVRVMPLPGRIAAGCGICLRVPPERRGPATALLYKNGVAVQGIHTSAEGGYKPFPAPVFSAACGLVEGDVAAIVGCGGKTSLANRLAMENRNRPVVLSTTTRMLMPPQSVIDRLVADTAAALPGVNLACRECGEKLRGLTDESLRRIRPENGITLVEADGSRGLPLKGWAEYEPVVPAFTTVTIGVCVVWPVGLRCTEAIVHRLEIFQNITGIEKDEIVGIDHIAAMVAAMFHKAVGRKMLYINQIETRESEMNAQKLADRVGALRVAAGSVRDGRIVFLREDPHDCQ